MPTDEEGVVRCPALTVGITRETQAEDRRNMMDKAIDEMTVEEILEWHAVVKVLSGMYDLGPYLERKLAFMKRAAKAMKEAEARGEKGVRERYALGPAMEAMFEDGHREKTESEEIANTLLALAAREWYRTSESDDAVDTKTIRLINRALAGRQRLYGWIINAWEAFESEGKARRWVEASMVHADLAYSKGYVNLINGVTGESSGWIPTAAMAAEGIAGRGEAGADRLPDIAAFISVQSQKAVKGYRQRLAEYGTPFLPEPLFVYTYVRQDNAGGLMGWTHVSGAGPAHVPTALPVGDERMAAIQTKPNPGKAVLKAGEPKRKTGETG
jgi:hypothetical protein